MGVFFDKPYHEERPWGSFVEFIHNEPSTVKILTVKAGEAISLQSHQQREEFWKILSGEGSIDIDGKETTASIGDTYLIPKNTTHRIKAAGNDMVVLEISIGIFDEKDITRIEDLYGRV